MDDRLVIGRDYDRAQLARILKYPKHFLLNPPLFDYPPPIYSVEHQEGWEVFGRAVLAHNSEFGKQVQQIKSWKLKDEQFHKKLTHQTSQDQNAF